MAQAPERIPVAGPRATHRGRGGRGMAPGIRSSRLRAAMHRAVIDARLLTPMRLDGIGATPVRHGTRRRGGFNPRAARLRAAPARSADAADPTRERPG